MKRIILSLTALLFSGLAFGQSTASFDPLITEALSRVEKEKGRRIAFAPQKMECPGTLGGPMCMYRSGSVIFVLAKHDKTGVLLATANRVGAHDQDWRDALEVLTALMEPAVSIERRTEAVGNLVRSSNSQGSVGAFRLGRSTLAAGFNKGGFETWVASHDEPEVTRQ